MRHNPMRELLRGKQRGLGQRRTGTETTRAGGATCGKDPATDTFRFPQQRPQRQAGTTHLPAPECSEKYAQEAGKKLWPSHRRKEARFLFSGDLIMYVKG